MSNDLLLPEFGLSCLSRTWVTHEYLMSFIWVLPSDKMATHFVTHMLLTCNEFCPSFTCVPPWVLPEYADLEWVLPLDKMATQSLLRKVSKNFFQWWLHKVRRKFQFIIFITIAKMIISWWLYFQVLIIVMPRHATNHTDTTHFHLYVSRHKVLQACFCTHLMCEWAWPPSQLSFGWL